MKNFIFLLISFLWSGTAEAQTKGSAESSLPPVPGKAKTAETSKTDTVTSKTDARSSDKKTNLMDVSKKNKVLKNDGYKIVYKNKTVKVVSNGTVLSKVSLPVIPLRYSVFNGVLFVAACGNAGLIVIDFSDPMKPVLNIYDKGKNITDFKVTGNTVISVGTKYNLRGYHIRSKNGRLMPLKDFLMSNRVKKIKKFRSIKVGKVVRVKRGYAVIKLISDKYVHVGTRVEIRDSKPSYHFDPIKNKNIYEPTMNVLCVADISDMRNGFAVVKLGKGDDPKVGNPVFLSEKSITASISIPKRIGNLWRGSFEIMPYPTSINDSDKTYMAMLMRFSADYHFKRPFHFKIAVDPAIYLGIEKFNSPFGANTYFAFSYDTEYFEIGIGAGYQWPLLSGESEHNRKGFLFVQQIRLGALDGFNTSVTVQSVYSDDNNDKIKRAMMGSFLGEVNLPLSNNLTMFGRYLGDGRVYNHMGLGLKTYLFGSGGHYSLIIPVSFGYTWIEPYYEKNGNEYQLNTKGVTFSIGMEGRY